MMLRNLTGRLLAASAMLVPAMAARAEERTGLAAKLLAEAGIPGGLVIHLGCGDGRLTAALHANDRYCVLGLDCDAKNVDTARRHVQSLGLYGPVSVDQWRGQQIPLIDNLANLIVVGPAGDLSATEVMRVLAPGGVAMTFREGSWAKTRKPRSHQIDEWSHSLHGGDNNPVADDLVVGPPKQLQWISGPRWSKHHERYPPTIPVLVSSAGRVFYFEEATPPCVFKVRTSWSLVARDAFNGTLLWRRPAPEWEPSAWPGDMGGGLSGGPVDYRRRIVAAGDRLYVTLGYRGPVVQLDAATGQTLRTYGDTASVSVELACVDGALFVGRLIDSKQGYQIARFDPESGRQLWQAPGGNGMAVDDGRVLFIDQDRLNALDARSGKLLWEATPLADSGVKTTKDRRGRKVRPKLIGPLRTGKGIVLACPGARGAVIAVSARDGRYLWLFQNQAFRPFFRPVTASIVNGLVWVTDQGKPGGDVNDDYVSLGLDPMTGEVRRRVPCGAVWNCGHHQRCYPSKATSRFLIFSRRGAEFLELADGDVGLNNWTRGACGYGVMPANGLLYSPPHACRCYSEVALRGLTALAPAERGPQFGEPEPDADRFQRGPAYSELPSPATGQGNDWPTFRHDAARSGSTDETVRAEPVEIWQADFGSPVSQAVVAGGRLVVAESDAHAVHTLDATTGRRLWSFTAGGRIDTPPTIDRERAIFGSADGWVYCLRANDGALMWRYRAAPHDLRMGAMGQIESVWPVHGSVLVRDGVAYFAAGRGSFVDGGIWLYGLDAATGSKIYEHHLEGPDTGAGFTRENPGRGFVMPGALPDVLVGDQQRVYMRHMAFDPKLEQATDMLPNFYAAPVREGEEFGGDHKYWCDLMDVGLRAFVGHPEWDYRSYFNHFPGRRLYSTTGLLDDSWHIRSYWAYGQIVGQYLVFDDDRGYAVAAYPNAARWASYSAGDGYLVYAGRTAVAPKGNNPLYALDRKDRQWEVTMPFRPVAMVRAGDKLVLAGPPDSSDPQEALAALLGKRGAVLHTVSTADGTTLGQLRLENPPIFDGLSIARGRLCIATRSGELICFE